MQRHLEWEGVYNARDLGGLTTREGRLTRSHQLIRSDALDGLTATGWAAVWAYGVRTVIDLRDDPEIAPDASPRPRGLTTIRLPLDGSADREFWKAWKSGPQFGTPLYYQPHLDRMPERSAAVITAIADAPPGGVVFHCAGGRDRSGQIAMLVLALADVLPDEIADDYALSAQRLHARYESLGEANQDQVLSDFLAERGTTARDIVLSILKDLDPARVILNAGASQDDISKLRGRLLGGIG